MEPDSLYDLAPLAWLMLVGVLIALGPLAWVWLRNRGAGAGRRLQALRPWERQGLSSCGDGVAFFGDGGDQRFAGGAAVYVDLAAGAVNAHGGVRVQLLHGLGHCALAVAACHALNVEGEGGNGKTPGEGG